MSGHRVEVDEKSRAIDSLTTPDYASTFEVERPAGDSRSAEQWARAVFEGAPRPMQLFLLTGWKGMLGLRIGPRPSPDHVLGMKIVTNTPETLVLAADSRTMSTTNVVRLEESRVTWTTFVRYENPAARAQWAVTAPFHHQTIPLLLTRAAGK